MRRLVICFLCLILFTGCALKSLVKLGAIAPDAKVDIKPDIDGTLTIEGDVASPSVVISSPKVTGVEVEIEKPVINIRELIPKEITRKTITERREIKPDGTIIEEKKTEEIKEKVPLTALVLLVLLTLLVIGLFIKNYIRTKKDE